MDKIARIKRLVESSLDTSYGDEISIVEMEIIPTQQYNEEVKEWVPFSHTIFLVLKKKNPPPKQQYYHFTNDGDVLNSHGVTRLLEGLLGFEVGVVFQ
jgi:hypothetical protein